MCWTKNLRPHLGGENEIEKNRKNRFKIFIGSQHMFAKFIKTLKIYDINYYTKKLLELVSSHALCTCDKTFYFYF